VIGLLGLGSLGVAGYALGLREVSAEEAR